MIDANIKELIAIGASVSANCHPCIKHHVGKAREMKIDEAEIQQAVEVGQMVRKGAAGQMDKLLEELSK
ncbi:MAG TPA: carboxymuconolactone decarboxylase family protein [Sedimentisphaerales bacterium]|nr:carboxymuconolactone decarboxylase family protein [Sedimentisphaerales bacterium]